jgi:hypothetical protein
MKMTTELTIVLRDKDQAMKVFSTPNGLDPVLQKVRDEIDSFVPDVSTAKGRAEVASMAHKVARSKTTLDDLGKDLVAQLKDMPRKIDAERKRMRDILDSWKNEVRAPLTAWEQAEKDRQQKHLAVIDWLENRAESVRDSDSITVREMLVTLNNLIIGEELEEYEAAAHRAKESAGNDLTRMAEEKEKAEAHTAELEKLRAEAAVREQADREARLQAEAAAKAKAEAEAQAERERKLIEEKAQAEREAAERREIDLMLAAEKAKREKLEAELREVQAKERAEAETAAAVERERKRVESIAQAEAAEQAKREADVTHRKIVNNAILTALVSGGVDEETAKTVILLIAKGRVPHVRIEY